MPRTAMHSRRSRPSCSVIALATVLAVGATPAAAQSFLGTGTYATNPNATGITTGVGTTTINLNPGQTVINWTPTDNATNTNANIVFQNAGTTATFTSGGDFSVLNNINTASLSRAIQMNGTVNARVGGVQRGNVYFYAPGGFVLGGSSVFSVGSLVVSASPIQWSANGFISNVGTDNTVVFGQALNPQAGIASAGSINANFVPFGVGSGTSSYVAMVAPRVQHTGTITVNGSAALVAAEAATINFSPDGLFDIQVTVGSDHDVGDGINVTGDIGGEAPSDASDQHRVYLVAVPKNDALTMVISQGADLGFTLANNASIDQYGAVVLSAGHDIVNGQIGSESAGSGAPANFWFTGAHATNDVFGEATGYADLYSTDGQASQLVTTFDSDVTVHAVEHVAMSSSGAGASLTVGGNLWLSTDAFADFGGGSAQGGDTLLYAQNGGSLTVAGNAVLTANGFGGSTESSGQTGGTGTGGKVDLLALDGGSLNIIGNVDLEANGYGGDSFDGNGGAGFGGAPVNGGGVTISAQGGELTLDKSLSASAGGFGGEAFQSGTTSGAGTGGSVGMTASSSGVVSVAGNSSIRAEGRGGTTWDTGANGGDGHGGVINLNASGTGSALSLTGGLFSANGEGGGPGEGTCCVAVGGDGLGGLINVSGSTGGLIESLGTLEFSAAGSGGYGSVAGGTGAGGDNGSGQGIFINAQGGLTLDVTGDLWLDASGSGGDSDGVAGTGTGGYAGLHVTGGTVDVSGEVNVDADGFGGDSVFGGNGGNGTGGVAEVLLTGGALTVDGRLLVEADGTGGDGDNFEGPLGNGGHGTGGTAGVFGNGGTLHVLGNLEITANGTGGFGAIGGNGFGTLAELAAVGGTVDIDGTALFSASGFGGEGQIGGAGHGGGELFDDGSVIDGARIFAQNGSITIDGTTTLLAIGEGAAGGAGDFGSSGGAGGNATGGWAGVTAANSNSGASSITLSALNISASASGGDGGQGGSGNQGGDGGAGGDAAAGDVTVFANAGNGHLTVTASVMATATANGGRGGDGGNGDGLSGGNGGAGGNAEGGHVQIGTASGNGQAATNNLGTATYGSILADTSATGGDGGDGNFGSPDGSGGAGGTGDGGASTLLVRGSTVTVTGATQLVANGQGGDGGFGGGDFGADGVGGDGFAGELSVLSTSRFEIPAQHGTLNAGGITGTAAGIGGLGSTDGAGIVEGGSSFEIDLSTVNIGSLDFDITGDAVDPGADPSFIRITDSTVDVDSTFAFSTIGDLSLYIANGSLTAGSVILSAADFVPDAELDEPANPGTLFATSLSVTSGGNFFADANLDVVNGIDITVPGSIRFDNARTDSFVDLDAQGGSIDIGNVNSASSTTLVADTFIAGGNIVAGGSIFAQAGGNIDLGSLASSFGSIFLDAGGDVDLTGNASADGDIEIDAIGDIVMQSATAGESVDLSAGGSVTAVNLTGGDSVLVEAGGPIGVDNVSAGLVDQSTNEGAEHLVRIVSGTSIETGDIEALNHIGLATPGTIDTGDIDAGGIFMALAHGDMNIGDAIAGEVFLSDYAVLNFGGLTATCIGECGSFGADGVVTAPPSGPSYAYVTTDGGVNGAGQLPGEGGTSGAPTNGSLYTTSEFQVAAGEALDFWFNYVTSDGSGFADYAWAGLYTANLDPVAILFTARTQPSGTIVPGFNLPGVEATLDPASVPIIGGAPTWSPLGGSSNTCFSAGCGYTGWISSSYEIADAGSYVLRFGVTNWTDTAFQSGMAFSGLSVGGVSLTPTLLTRTGGSITIGNVQTGKFSAAAGTSLTTGIIDSTGSITLDAGGAINTQNLFAGNFVLGTGGSITTQNIEAGSVDMTSTSGNITTQNIDAVGAVALRAANNINTQNIDAGSVAMRSTSGNITIDGDVFAANAVDMDAVVGNIDTGDIAGASIDLLAGNDISTGDLTTQGLAVLAQEGPVTTFLFPGASITLDAGGDISTGDIASIDGVHADAGATLSTGGIDALDFVQLLAGGNINTGAINAGGFIDVLSSSGAITTQALTADGDIDLDAGGNIAFATANAGGEFDFSAGGSVTGGSIVAGSNIGGDAAGTVTLGNLTAGLPEGDDFSIGIAAIGNITVANATGAGPVGFATQGNLATGNLNAGDLVMTLVGGNTTTGSITTGGEGGGRVYMADDSMFLTGGGSFQNPDNFNAAIVLGVDPVATGGSITINGAISTGLFQAAAGTTLTTRALSAEDAFAFAGGLAAINGAWNVGDAKVISNDIDIGTNGSITADGDITLVSKNATRTVVGDGTNLAGYNLSNTEFGKLNANDVTIIADTSEGAAANMVIGNLNVNAGGFPGGVDYEFLTGNGDTEIASGSIRIVGNAVFNGMTSGDHSVNFGTALFELDAATGSISLFSSGSTLGGELGLYADRIHVAAGSILDQLRVNPTYTGYQQDLNEAAAVQRPEGVLRADTLWIESANLTSLLIQNTGTFDTPAGFVVRQAFVNEDSEVAGPPGSINLVVNGQVVGEGGTLTGVAARDALITEETDITPFTANSTINGCPLTGACIIAPPPPPPTSNVVDNFIDLITGNPLGDSDFGNEEDIDDNSEGDEGASNPISPPQPLFDTRPLIPSGDVNDPVSGTGNPALLGGNDQCETEEGGQCTANPPNGDGQ